MSSQDSARLIEGASTSSRSLEASSASSSQSITPVGGHTPEIEASDPIPEQVQELGLSKPSPKLEPKRRNELVDKIDPFKSSTKSHRFHELAPSKPSPKTEPRRSLDFDVE